MARYRTFTTVTDNGPYVTKLILELPGAVRTQDVDEGTFSVYVERIDPETGEIALAKEHRKDPVGKPSLGYVPVRHAYAASEAGKPAPSGSHVALELPECKLTKRVDGEILYSSLREMRFRVTQVSPMSALGEGEAPLSGLTFAECAGDVCPQLAGWDLCGRGTFDGIELAYALYSPDIAAVNARKAAETWPFAPKWQPIEKAPLLLWLHGAGEGGCDPYLTVTGNKVVALGEAEIQAKLGGAAYVLCPTCPTFWMDSGSGQMEDDNQTIYAGAVMALLAQVLDAHPDIDRSRVYVGGLSNGGFMTCRLIVDHPDTFAAAVACCAPWVGALGTDDEYEAMAKTPIWFVQVDDDPLVTAENHLKALWPRLQAHHPADAHATYYDHISDETGAYHDEDGRPTRYMGHVVWINVYHDTVKTELDGTNVMWQGFPVTLWQWVGRHSR